MTLEEEKEFDAGYNKLIEQCTSEDVKRILEENRVGMKILTEKVAKHLKAIEPWHGVFLRPLHEETFPYRRINSSWDEKFLP